jgi:hypothetical protein
MLNSGKESITMTSKAFEVGDKVRVVEYQFGRGPEAPGGTLGIVRSVDKNRRRTEPYYIYYVEIPGEETLIDFEYRDLELVPPDEERDS